MMMMIIIIATCVNNFFYDKKRANNCPNDMNTHTHLDDQAYQDLLFYQIRKTFDV